MEREIYVSTSDGISVLSLKGERLRSAALEAAGALCVRGERLYCAGNGDHVILRLDRQTLLMQAIFAGGPGICDLCLSADGKRLYALCADADSLLMLDADSGQPIVVCRVGCNPRQMTMQGDLLVVAGGESGCVHLLDALALRETARLTMPGPVYSAVLSGGAVHALCLTPALDTLLVTVLPGGRERLMLGGMPGCLLPGTHALLAAAQGRMYAVSQDGRYVLGEWAAPGRARQMMTADGCLMFVDQLGEQIFACEGTVGRWRRLCVGARAAALG